MNTKGQKYNNKLLEQLSPHINYDPKKGSFKWIHAVGGQSRVGKIAGCVGGTGYLVIGFKGRRLRAHRLAWFKVYGAPIPDVLDHINGDPLDNKISNIRESNETLNAQNKKPHREGQLLGASYHKRDKKWASHGFFNKKSYWFGYFNTMEKASRACKKGLLKLRGKK